jgi:hypothetical protein
MNSDSCTQRSLCVMRAMHPYSMCKWPNVWFVVLMELPVMNYGMYICTHSAYSEFTGLLQRSGTRGNSWGLILWTKNIEHILRFQGSVWMHVPEYIQDELLRLRFKRELCGTMLTEQVRIYRNYMCALGSRITETHRFIGCYSTLLNNSKTI